MPLTFSEKARVTSGDFSYECKISRLESKAVSVDITSTNAKGLNMNYDGRELYFEYADYSHTVNADYFEKKNAAMVIYDVFDEIESMQSVTARKTDIGCKYDGRISLGDFTLILNNDNTLNSITIKTADLTIEFI